MQIQPGSLEQQPTETQLQRTERQRAGKVDAGSVPLNPEQTRKLMDNFAAWHAGQSDPSGSR